ncbi:MAG: T9SS type A sorting domain-containing protein [Dysgonamonadaceae bacterium]|jgi:uncharacterized membrane protein|nr:T9SS type A sorting domain-containing protein [Dysgonamonadaceae bacterium]
MKQLHLSFLCFFLFFFLSINGQSFRVIQSNSDSYVCPHGLSSNGQYVVGRVGEAVEYAGHHTFVWSPTGSLVEWDRDSANPEGMGSTGVAVSNTGRVAGVAPDPTTLVSALESDIKVPFITASFRDYTSQAWTILPLLPNINTPFDGFGSRAYGISDDGRIIVGGQTPGGQAQRLTAGYWDVSDPVNVEYHSLLTNAQVGYGSVARAVSGDGKIIGGQETYNGITYTVLWINGEKKRISGSSGEPVMAVSNNGKYAVFQKNLRATLYTIETGIDETIDLSAEIASIPLAVSNNGIVVGHWNPGGSAQKAFIYTRSLGIVSLKDFLSSHNIDCPLSSILSVSGISANGRIIIGHGTLGGKIVGFYAEIPEISGDGLLPIRNINVNQPAYGTVELSWEAPEIPDGEVSSLVAYRIYEGETPVETVNASIKAHTFTAVTDGTYQYSVKAVYEQDGKQEEAIAGKTIAVTVSRKTILFYEPFDNYQTGGMQFDQTFQDEIPLSTGGWDVSAHTVPFSETWKVNKSGRPPHSAGFVAPLSGEYSEELNSPFFDLREAEDLFLAFEYGVTNSPTPELEKLAIEIYDGEAWHGVDTISSAGTETLFVNRYYDLSEYAGKDNIRFRFRCFGTGTTGVNWFIDNVELTNSANFVSIADPLVVSARQAGKDRVHINWSDPYGTVSLRYMLDDEAIRSLGNSQYPYIAANMYPAEDLSAYEGYYLTSISFWRTKNDKLPQSAKQAQYRVFASQDGKRIAADTIVNPKLKWNTIQLKTPVQIDVTKPLYYGVEIVDADPNDWPIGSGTYYILLEKPENPYDPYIDLDKIDGRGNVYSEDGGQTWRKVSEDGENFLYDLFCIRATLSQESTPVSPLATRRITGYKVYRNGQSLLEEEQGRDYSIPLNNFTDTNPVEGDVCYTVKTYFYDYEVGHTLSGGVSSCITVNGIALVKDANGWYAYPNSVKSGETIRVEIRDAVNPANATVRIYDMAGKLVKEVPVKGSVTPVRMDIGSGAYILKVNEQEAVKVIVK